MVAEYYKAADICIHSAKEETFGKVVAEAMSCGIPIVATAVGGIPEQIKNGITGLLVPQGKPQNMTAAVNSLLDDEPLRLRMGKSAKIDAHKRFSLEHQAMSFLNWYEEILQDWSEREKGVLSPNKRFASAAES
jgi:glycosyltransferase involved in cell wall biosynthesis